MLDRYQLLSTAFSDLCLRMMAKNGGKGVSLVINNSSLFDSDFSDEFGVGVYSDIGSSLASSAKKQSKSSLKCGDMSTTTARSAKSSKRDFLSRTSATW
jgi:hypothetical protein